MLSSEDSRRLAQLERQLHTDDPGFCARMESGQPPLDPRRRAPLTLIIATGLLWPIVILLGGFGLWIPAVLAAVLATATASALVHRLLENRSRRV